MPFEKPVHNICSKTRRGVKESGKRKPWRLTLFFQRMLPLHHMLIPPSTPIEAHAATRARHIHPASPMIAFMLPPGRADVHSSPTPPSRFEKRPPDPRPLLRDGPGWDGMESHAISRK